jgi:hypothetical protein
MKPDKNFRLSKPTKTMLALGHFRDAQDRNTFKRAMIQAELQSKLQPRSKREKNEKEVR